MIVYPAIDLRGGRCVRLEQGDLGAETVFAQDPVEAARRWAREGACWLHIVNLDGALGRSGTANLRALGRILASVDLPAQFGGGLRSIEDVDRLFDLGVARVILGTVAVCDPGVVEDALAHYGPDRVSVAIDARVGHVAIQGWSDTSPVQAIELASQMNGLGLKRVVYTDIERDGMLAGINIEATVRLARTSGLSVIASGGVASLEDIRLLGQHAHDGIEGVIIGMALYRGVIQLPQALEIAQGE